MPGPRVVKMLKFSKSGNHRRRSRRSRCFGNQRITPGGEIKRAASA
jgi:RNA-binding protein